MENKPSDSLNDITFKKSIMINIKRETCVSSVNTFMQKTKMKGCPSSVKNWKTRNTDLNKK